MCERIICKENLNQFKFYLLREEKSENTMEKYLRDLRAFAEFTSGNIITKEMVIEYKNKLISEKYAVRSINSMLASLNSFSALWAGMI